MTQNPVSGSSLPTGTPVTYTILVTNAGSATIDSLAVDDTLPPQVTQVVLAPAAGFTVTGPRNAPSGTLYGWAGGALNFYPGAALTFTINGVVGEMCTARDIVNTAYVASTAGPSTTCMTTGRTSLTGQPYTVGVSVVKNQILPVTPTVSPGSPVQYQIVVTNTGAATLTDVIVTDTLQRELQSVTSTSPGLTTSLPTGIPGGGTRWMWSGTGLSFQPGQTLTITVNAVAGVVGSDRGVSNTAFVTAANACGLTASAQSAPATGFGIEAPNAAVAVETRQTPASGSALYVGDRITYLIVVTNTGDVTLYALSVIDTVGAEVGANSSTQDDAQFSTVVTSMPGTGTRYEWSNPGFLSFGPGHTFSFTVTGVIGSVCAPILRENRAAAFGSGPAGPAPTVLSAPTSFATTPRASAVTVAKVLVPAQPESGGPMAFDLTIVNVGQDTIANLHVTDLLPPTSQFTATVLADGGYSATLTVTGVIGTRVQYDWDFGDVPPGTVKTAHIGGLAGDCYTGTISNTVTVTGNTPCGAPIVQSASSSVLLQGPAAMLTRMQDYFPNDPTRTVHSIRVQPGVPVYWKLIVANTGGKPADDVMIVDTLPSLGASIDRIQIAGWPDAGPSGTEWAEVAALPNLTTTSTGGMLMIVLGGTAYQGGGYAGGGLGLQPGESVTVWMDITPLAVPSGSVLIRNSVHTTWTDPCSGGRLSTASDTAGFIIGTSPGGDAGGNSGVATLRPGRLLIAPNVLRMAGSDPGAVTVYANGSAGGRTDLRIYDAGGRLVGTLVIPLGLDGRGSVAISGLLVGGRLGAGIYTVTAHGGGVDDRAPFAVVRVRP